MERHESIIEVGYLKAMFPGTNQEQEDFWFEQFLKFPRDVVRESIAGFAENHGDFVDRPGLLALIKDRVASPDSTPEERAAAAVAESEAKRRRDREDASRSKMSFAQCDRVLEGLSDEDLDELKVETLKCLPSATADFLEKSGIRTGKTLRYHMANRLRGLPVG